MPSERDNLYFLESIVFKVENRLFKVYRHHFMESDIFNTTFSLPSGNVQAEGTSEENPFVLHGITATDFQAFLKAISPLSSTTWSGMTREEWLSAIKLSTMWGFVGARELSIERLSKVKLSPTDKIVFGKKYQVFSWLKEGYAALIKREDVMTAKELYENAEVLGWDTMARVLRFRDMGYGASSKSLTRQIHPNDQRHVEHNVDLYCRTCNCWTTLRGDQGLDEEIEREFKDDFSSTELGAAT